MGGCFFNLGVGGLRIEEDGFYKVKFGKFYVFLGFSIEIVYIRGFELGRRLVC